MTERGRQLALAATTRLNLHVFDDLGVSEDDAADLTAILERLRQSAGDY